MSMPELTWAGLKKPAVWEYALRFAFGGVVTASTGLVAKLYGPAVGGMFLAFPAILPASLTLVKRHDGRAQAEDDAKGARLGALALAAFAAMVAITADRWPAALVLSAGTAAWIGVAVAAWRITYGRR